MVQTSGDCIAAHQWYLSYVRFDSEQTSYVNMKVHLFKTYLEIMTKKVDISLTTSPSALCKYQGGCTINKLHVLVTDFQ